MVPGNWSASLSRTACKSASTTALAGNGRSNQAGICSTAVTGKPRSQGRATGTISGKPTGIASPCFAGNQRMARSTDPVMAITLALRRPETAEAAALALRDVPGQAATEGLACLLV